VAQWNSDKGAQLAITSTRSDIVVEERPCEATLTLVARNPLVSWIVTVVGAFACVWPVVILAYGFLMSNYGTVLIMTVLTATIVWLTWRIGWRPRPFAMTFSRDSLQVGRQRFAYSDIRSFGVSGYGGDVVDPVSIGVPRNVTIGPHVYIETGGRHLPITVGLKAAQAKEALRVFGELFARYRSA